MRVKGKLTVVGSGEWKFVSSYSGGKTKVSVLEIGGHKIRNVTVPDALKDYLVEGQEMELLIIKGDLIHYELCGVKVQGNTYRHGATTQLVRGTVLSVMFGWLVIPLIPSFMFLRSYTEISTF
jgi:hypothetical protein